MPNDLLEGRRMLEKSLRNIEQMREERRHVIQRTDLPEERKRLALRHSDAQFRPQIKQINDMLAQWDFAAAMARASERDRKIPPPLAQNRKVGSKSPSEKFGFMTRRLEQVA